MDPRELMGSNNRFEGRFLSNPPRVVFPQIFHLHDRQQDSSLPIHAIRPLPGPRSVYTRHETSYERDPQKRHNKLLPIRRNSNNTILIPGQRLEYLRVIFNFRKMTLSIPETKSLPF